MYSQTHVFPSPSFGYTGITVEESLRITREKIVGPPVGETTTQPVFVPGNPSVGVLRFQDKYYVFSSREAAELFSGCPDDFIARVGERARSCPELIQLLELHRQFTGATPYSEVSHAPTLRVSHAPL